MKLNPHAEWNSCFGVWALSFLACLLPAQMWEREWVSMSNPWYRFRLRNCKASQQEVKQVSAIDRPQTHTELKHKGGGTAAENMSILLFRKGALLGGWKQINMAIDPDNPALQIALRAMNKTTKTITGLLLTSNTLASVPHFQMREGFKRLEGRKKKRLNRPFKEYPLVTELELKYD